MPANSHAVRSYPISPLRRSILWWLLGPMVVIGVAIIVWGEGEKRTAGAFMLLLMAPWLAWWHWYTGRLRLEFSAEGVTHRHGRLVMHASWSQIERVRLDKAREGFVVREPLQGRATDQLASVRGFWIAGVAMYDAEQQRLMGERRFIPIDPFVYLLRNGYLLADLDEFAPELGKTTREAVAEQERKVRLPKAPATPQQQMKQLWLFLVVVALIGLGVWMAMAPQSRVARTADWIMTLLVALSLPLWALVSVLSSRNAFRAGSKILGILFALLAVVQALLGWVVISQLLQRVSG